MPEKTFLVKLEKEHLEAIEELLEDEDIELFELKTSDDPRPEEQATDLSGDEELEFSDWVETDMQSLQPEDDNADYRTRRRPPTASLTEVRNIFEQDLTPGEGITDEQDERYDEYEEEYVK